MRFGRLSRPLAAGALAILGAVALVRALPVYFRADDALYLQWASRHPSPLAAFSPVQASMIGVFRPLQNLAWWSLWRVFGLHPEPYQLLVTLLFLACLGLLVRLGRRLFSPGAGWCSLIAFLAFFPYLVSVVFWFSDLSFLMESVLMLAAVNLLVEAVAGRVSFTWAVGAYVLSVLAKEPAAFIVPAAGAALLLAEWRETGTRLRRRGAMVVVGLAAAGAAVALLHPSLGERQAALGTSGWGELVAFAGERWRFYATQLTAGAGAGLVALAVLALWARVRPRDGSRVLTVWLPVAVAFGIGVLLRGAPTLATALTVICLLGLIAQRRREGVGGAWFFVPFLGLLTISFAVRTYLFEAAFGLALVAGATLAELAAEAWADLRRVRRAAVAGLACALVVALALAGARLGAGVGTRLAVLQVVSAARLNFRDAVGALLGPPITVGPVVVVDYADMGLDYVRDIVPLPDLEKARRQKTMMSHELAAFLEVAGAHAAEVVTLSTFMRLPAGSPALLVVMNTGEDRFVAGLPFQRHLVFESVRGGEVARVYRVVR
jgi:hypothetical protein